MRQNKILYAAIALGVLLSVAAVAVILRGHLAADNIDRAILAFSKASAENAALYAPAQFDSAQQSRIAMFAEWRNQNSRFVLVRNFGRTNELGRAFDSLSQSALTRANTVRDSLRSVVPAQGDCFAQDIKKFKNVFGNVPMEQGMRDRVTRCELALSEGQKALERADLVSANTKFAVGREFIKTVFMEMHRIVDAYLGNFTEWTQWTDETIAWSKSRNKPAIVIDKIGHTLFLYQGGRLKNKFQVELGVRWMGGKLRKGDRATPEGRYFIRRKKNKTLYHKALEIDYPNAQDRIRLKIANNNSPTVTAAVLGGNIEIHGKGGKQCNWTDGCAALTDADMDTLYSLVSEGTPVTIVGTCDKSCADSFR